MVFRERACLWNSAFIFRRRKDLAGYLEGWSRYRDLMCEGLPAGGRVSFCGLGVSWRRKALAPQVWASAGMKKAALCGAAGADTPSPSPPPGLKFYPNDMKLPELW